MKILLFTENTHRGGLDSFLIDLINHWPDPAAELTLIGNRSHPGLGPIAASLRRPCRIVGHRIALQWEWLRRLRHLPALRKLVSPPLRYLFFAYYVAALRRLFAGFTADRLLVVSGGYPGGDSCRAAVVAWGLGAARPKAILNFHNLAVAPRWWERWIENRIDRLVLRHCRHLVGVSAACARSLANRPAIGLADQVTHVYDGIAEPPPGAGPPAAGLKAALGFPAASRLLLMLGTYEPRKGHRFLLEAFRRVLAAVPQARLAICGYGYPEERAAVARLVESFGLAAAVRLEGFRDDVRALLGEADVLVVSSQAFESFGLAVVEAWAARVPVVATRVGGIPEVIGEDEGGFCVAADDVEGFAAAIVRLLADEPLRRRLGDAGYRRYRRHFTAERMAAEYARLIEASAGGDSASGSRPAGPAEARRPPGYGTAAS